jgi:hypothetical protein
MVALMLFTGVPTMYMAYPRSNGVNVGLVDEETPVPTPSSLIIVGVLEKFDVKVAYFEARMPVLSGSLVINGSTIVIQCDVSAAWLNYGGLRICSYYGDSTYSRLITEEDLADLLNKQVAYDSSTNTIWRLSSSVQ